MSRMSVDDKELKIAQYLKQGLGYNEILEAMREEGNPTSNDKISEVKKMIANGVIAFSAEGKAMEKEPKLVADIHQEVMGVVTKKAAEEAVRFAEEDYGLGREIRQFWFLKAQEKGMSIRDFVKAALIFYDDYRDLSAENEELRKISQTALKALSVNTITRKKLELYYKFCADALKLRAQGLSVPEQVIVDFYSDLEYMSKGGTTPIREVITSGSEEQP